MRRFAISGLICILVFCFSRAFTQGFYMRGQAGYALGVNKQHIDSKYEYDAQGNETSVEDIYHSFGKGIKLRGAMGFLLSSNIAIQFESGLSLAAGKTLEQQFNSTTSKNEITAWNIPFLASIVARSNSENVRPYVGAGGGFYLFFMKYKMTNSNSQALSEFRQKFKFPIGFHGFVGLEFPAGESFSFYMEVRFVSLGLYPSESELTAAKNANGDDILDQIPDDQKKQKYKKDSLDDPAPDLVSASNLGVFFGLKITLAQ